MPSRKNPYCLVDMPEKNFVVRTVESTGAQYVYYSDRSTRTKGGKIKYHRVCIGMKDPSTGKMYPNNNYTKIFGVKKIYLTQRIDNQYIRQFGHFALIDQVVRKTSLKQTLMMSFPTKWRKILSLAMYSLVDGGTLNDCDLWFGNSSSYMDSSMTKDDAHQIFSSVSWIERTLFFNIWRRICQDRGSTAYELRSLISMKRAMRGIDYNYSLLNDSYSQTNIALFEGKNSKLPIYYNVLGCRLENKSDLVGFLYNTSSIDIYPDRYVIEKTFYSEETISFFIRSGKKFICPVELSLSGIEDKLSDAAAAFSDGKNQLSDDLYCYKDFLYQKTPKSTKIDLYIYFSLLRKEAELRAQDELVAVMEKELSSVTDFSDKNLKKYNNYFHIELVKEGFSYRRNTEQIYSARELFGYYCVITNDYSLSSESLYEIMRRKNEFEKSFDNIENINDLVNMKTPKDVTVSGSIFVAFVTQIIKSYIDLKLREHNLKYERSQDKSTLFDFRSFTVTRVLKDMASIIVSDVYGTKEILRPLSNSQKAVQKLFDFDCSKALANHL